MSCLTEYNEEETMQMFKEEGRAEGRAEGMELGAARKLMEQVACKLKKGKSPEVIAEELEEEPSVINGIISSIKADA